MKPIPQVLLDSVRYESGTLYWITPKQGRSTSRPICNNKDRYACINYEGKKYQLSRVVYALHHGDPGELIVDHINQDKRDNRIENLRAITQAQNMHNHPGLNIRKRGYGFTVCVGKKYHGHYPTYELALTAKLKAREEIINVQ